VYDAGVHERPDPRAAPRDGGPEAKRPGDGPRGRAAAGAPGRLARGEAAFVAAFAGALALATSLPYAVAWTRPFPDSRFDGHLVFDADFNAYLAFMRQARDGAWLFYNPFTPEPHAPVLLNLGWLAAGRLAAASGLSLETVLQVQRLAALAVLCGAVYALARRLLRSVLGRRAALAAVMLGGGFGWLTSLPGLRGRLPPGWLLDNTVGFHPFFWALLHPHFLLAQALAALTLCLVLRAESTGRARDWGVAAAAATLVSLRPYDWVHLVATLGAFATLTAWGRRGEDTRTARALRFLPVAAAVPLLAYHVWLFEAHPVFRWWHAQSRQAPVPPLALALTWGLSLAGVLLAAPRLLALPRRPPAERLVGAALLTGLAFFYASPLVRPTLQFATTLIVPGVLLAAARLEPWLLRHAGRGGPAAAGLALLLAANSLTSAKLLAAHIRDAAAGHHRTDVRLLEAYGWLDAHAAPRDVVLAPLDLGSGLPRRSRAVAFAGFFSTVDYAAKAAQLERFFAPGGDDAWRQDLLRRHRVRFVLAGAGAAAPAAGPAGRAPLDVPYLVPAFRNDLAAVYRVALPP
jgi:hypothetical protein